MKEEIITMLNELGDQLYKKFGTDSYNERCKLHDIKEKVNHLTLQR